MKIKFGIIVFCLLLLGCKDQDSGVQHITTPNGDPVFRLILQATVARDDTFALYYTTNNSIAFNSKQTVWVAVKSSPNPQDIKFELPSGILPSQLRIDLGSSQKQSAVRMESVKMSYRDKQVVIPGMLILSYFRPDVRSTDIDSHTMNVTGKIVGARRATPSLYPKEAPLARQLAFLSGH